MAKVRRATKDDIETLVVMGRAMHAESPRYCGMRFDADKVRRLARDLTGQLLGEMGAVFVAEADGQIIGMAAIIMGERWFGPERYVTDLVVYLKPEHRGSGAFPRLVRAMEEWSGTQGAAQIDLGVSTGVTTDATVCAYQRLGYTLDATRILTKKLHVHGN